MTKYKDPISQTLVRDLIVSLIEHHPITTFEHMNNVLKTILSKDLIGATSLKASQAAIIALGWSIILATHEKRDTELWQVEFPKLIEYQIGFYQYGISSTNGKISEKAFIVTKQFFDQNPGIHLIYFDKLLSNDTPTSNGIVFLSMIINYQIGIDGNQNLLDQNYSKLIDHFIKGLITSKIKPNVNYFAACSIILKSINTDTLQKCILPALQRSMLRSPEIILQGVGAILQELQVDVSPYAMDIGKTLIQNLYTKDDVARSEAVESLKQLSLKCSDPKSIGELIEKLFAVLNGSDGKITVAEYRINILQGAGHLSANLVAKNAIDPLLKTVTEHFIKTLDTEIQEKVLCHALEMFSLWAINFTGTLSKTITDVFRKGIDSKSATQSVRVAYLQWLLACLQNSNLPDNIDLSSSLINSVEKAAQNVTQVPLVAEAVCSVCLLLKTENMKSIESMKKLQSFFNIVLDMTKQVFVSEKFLQSAPSDTLCYVVLMCQLLLIDHSARIKGSLDPIYRAIIYSVHSSSQKVRNYCLPLLSKLVHSTDGISIAKHLLFELTKYIQMAKVTIDDETHVTDDGSIPAKAFVTTIRTLSEIQNIPSADAQTIALSSLLCCHHPAIISHTPELWNQILKRIELDPKSFISLNSKHIRLTLIDEYLSTSIYENALGCIARISPEIILPIIIDDCIRQLNDPEMSNVTDEEYFTYSTPDGELYDKSVIPNSDDIYKDLSMKRENKVYTYKEQLEEIQLRRELEEKKRKEGKWKPPQFTQKQQDAIDKQFEKEKAIKLRLQTLNNAIVRLVSLINGARIGNPDQFSLYFAKLLPCILAVLKSPLAATPLTNVYFNLRTACFRDNFEVLGKQIAIATLRLHAPHCDLNEEWTKDDLTQQIKTVLETYTIAISINESIQIENDDDSNNVLLTAPAFAYAFEFFKKAFFTKGICTNEEFLLGSIQLCGKQARVRGTTLTGELNDYRHPKHMPRYEMERILLKLISVNSGRVQTQAVAVLLDVAASSSSENYCTKADRDEIACMMEALQSHLEAVRDVSLRCLNIMRKSLPTLQDDCEFGLELIRRIWIAKHDVSEENRTLADTLWSNGNFELPSNLHVELLKDVVHSEPCVQIATAMALVSIIREDTEIVQGILAKLLEIYAAKLTMIPAKLDQFDREIEPAIDQWGPRRGVAIALCKIAPYFSLKDVDRVMQFMVAKGLGDREEIVHKEMLAAALSIVDCHGKETIGRLLPVFEMFLDKAPKSSFYDNVRQAVVILMGSLARHLEKDDERIQPIVKRLMTALSTPSQQVQEAVANCLPHLMPSVKDEAPAIIKKLLNQLVKSEKYGERRGAAYGIAGVVKGLGILSLKQYDIMTKLTHHIQEKKNYKSREGALFAFEMLCTTLGRLFEPYIVHVLPHLLQCFGDSSQYVRQAADDTAKVVMGKLSAHGVKLVLPSLLNALDEDSWRTKTASVELLGAMAYCAPKQLSSCLPSIVPKLIEVLGDSHTKVQEAGGDALKVIGSVIKNPEIQAIVPVLLKALEDPSANTSKCLQSLLETKFVHFIDAPSLALIMPVVQRAFMDRSTETRKMAAQIIGNMYSLTDQKDLTPYLPNIIPGLKTSLLDPVPEVRAVSARALGAMVSKIYAF